MTQQLFEVWPPIVRCCRCGVVMQECEAVTVPVSCLACNGLEGREDMAAFVIDFGGFLP